MCSIAGELRFEAAPGNEHTARVQSRAVVSTMNDALRHRGPDDAGLMSAGPLTMGMRRLSIIDLEGGQQPIANEDRSVWVVCNGEIYNYRALQAELRARGHQFRTGSDVEVLVHLYEDYGLNFVERLRGMFAFAIWDQRARRLVLGRDRLGIKPLVFSCDSRRLLFASEIKALIAAGVDRDIDMQALHHYLTLSYVPAPHTAFTKIRKLLPGHLLVAENGRVRLERYWRLGQPPILDGIGEDDYVEALKDRLDDAVRSHLVSDVPVGVFLSGGLDSATILAYMRRHERGTIKTFSVGFEDSSFDELKDARATAKHFGTEHHELTVSADIADTMPALIESFDEPFADSSAIPLYHLSRFASEHVKVVLTGEGGDEVLAGYQTYVASKLAMAYRQLPDVVARRIVPQLVRLLPVSHRRVSFDYKANRFVRGALLPFDQAHLSWKQILSEEAKAELYVNHRNGYIPTTAFYGNVYAGCPSRDWLTRLLHVDTAIGLPDDMLTKADRVTMAHSLEARVPLLDHELVEFLASVPSNLKLRGRTTKYLLRAAMRGQLPRRIVQGKKRGFNVPMPGWLATDLRSFVGDVLSPARVARTGLFRPEAVSNLVNQHLQRRADHSRTLWTLIVLEHWVQRHALAPAEAAAGWDAREAMPTGELAAQA
jgi:asparagine synthase (glutamine-hydrolysing)